MKIFRLATLISVIAITLLSGCLKDPGNPVITASKSTVAVDEELTLTLTGAENYTCLEWHQNDGDGVEAVTVSGGDEDNLTWTVKFGSTGTSTLRVAVKNCKDGCSGKCRDEYAEITIVIE